LAFLLVIDLFGWFAAVVVVLEEVLVPVFDELGFSVHVSVTVRSNKFIVSGQRVAFELPESQYYFTNDNYIKAN
jgi:hypothetical protein